MARILEVRDLVTKFYTVDGVAHAVNGVSFDLDEGETLAIVGESGSGKSVTVMSILGLIASPPGKVESGTARFTCGGQTTDLLKLSPRELRDVRGGQIGFVFQDPISSLNPLIKIGEQISESIVKHTGASRDAARQRTIQLLTNVGIPDPELRYDAYPFQFSGGMRQRVMIAIAIACAPQIIIADEPTTALDVTVQAQVVDLFKRLRKELDTAVIWITHDLGVVAGLAHRVLIMYGGRVAEVGPLDEVYDTPAHPYTIGLLGALPRLDADDDRRLVGIEGAAPDLMAPLAHCPFAPRCPHAFEPCWEAIPELRQVGLGHFTACYYDLAKGGPHAA
ncbi:MAG: ABC transporter ATP-binding protein [Anaerolineae bacterium]|jgi:oligopeptide/dipeptide ABC transporter ATP-binding protein|nr:ABC transporter ATP-binding protein [Anaerolineae bacterium]